MGRMWVKGHLGWAMEEDRELRRGFSGMKMGVQGSEGGAGLEKGVIRVEDEGWNDHWAQNLRTQTL